MKDQEIKSSQSCPILGRMHYNTLWYFSPWWITARVQVGNCANLSTNKTEHKVTAKTLDISIFDVIFQWFSWGVRHVMGDKGLYQPKWWAVVFMKCQNKRDSSWSTITKLFDNWANMSLHLIQCGHNFATLANS